MSEAPSGGSESERLPATLLDFLEEWMEVLIVGLSPAALGGRVSACATVRASRHPPAGPWDAILARATGRSSPPLAFREALRDLRRGGRAALLLEAAADPDEARLEFAKLSKHIEEEQLPDGRLLISAERSDAGPVDLVGLRRLLREHESAPDRLEALEENLDSARRRGDSGVRLRFLVGLLGDLDRFWGLPEALRRLGRPEAEPGDPEALAEASDHPGRPLAELLTRFRHFRAQSSAALAEISGEDFPSGKEECSGLVEHLRSWRRREEAIFSEIGGTPDGESDPG